MLFELFISLLIYLCQHTGGDTNINYAMVSYCVVTVLQYERKKTCITIKVKGTTKRSDSQNVPSLKQEELPKEQMNRDPISNLGFKQTNITKQSGLLNE